MKYIEDTNYQRFILQELKNEINSIEYSVGLAELQQIYSIELKIEVLERTLKLTEDILNQYHNNMEEAIIQLKLQLRSID